MINKLRENLTERIIEELKTINYIVIRKDQIQHVIDTLEESKDNSYFFLIKGKILEENFMIDMVNHPENMNLIRTVYLNNEKKEEQIRPY